MRLRQFPLILLLALALAPAAARAGDREPVLLPEAGIRLAPPPGMHVTEDGRGLSAKGDRVRIRTRLFPRPLRLTLVELRSGALAEDGQELLATETAETPEGNVTLFRYASPREPDRMESLLVAVGDEAESVVLSAEFDSAEADRLRPVLREALVTVRRVPRPRRAVRGAPVTLIPPPRFEPATAFAGYQYEAKGASVMVTAIPGPYSKVVVGMSESRLQRAGMRVASRTTLLVGGLDGTLLRVDQDQSGVAFRKWLLVCGDPHHTLVVNGVFPKEFASEISSAIRRAVLSVRDAKATADPFDDLPYAIEAVPPLQRARTMGFAAAFTRNGRFPLTDPEEPVFVISPSVGGAPIEDRKGLALRRLRAVAGVTDVRVLTTREVEIDGLPGLESLAWGRSTESSAEMAIYQVVLFHGRGYYVAVGLAPAAEEETYLRVFRKTAESFRRR